MSRSLYDSRIHHRRSIRLQQYDYSQNGAYFVTICCYNQEAKFGVVEDDIMTLNDAGMIAYNEWCKLVERYPHFELDVFQIMPNHMHGIIVLSDYSNGLTLHQQRESLSDIVGAYKSLVANACLDKFKEKWQQLSNATGADDCPQMGKIWQRNFHEHIIRDEASYQKISAYIINNPANWLNDKFYTR